MVIGIKNKKLLLELKNLGLTLKAEEKNIDAKFAGKIFVMTGKLENYSREEITKKLKNLAEL